MPPSYEFESARAVAGERTKQPIRSRKPLATPCLPNGVGHQHRVYKASSSAAPPSPLQTDEDVREAALLDRLDSLEGSFDRVEAGLEATVDTLDEFARVTASQQVAVRGLLARLRDA